MSPLKQLYISFQKIQFFFHAALPCPIIHARRSLPLPHLLLLLLTPRPPPPSPTTTTLVRAAAATTDSSGIWQEALETETTSEEGEESWSAILRPGSVGEESLQAMGMQAGEWVKCMHDIGLHLLLTSGGHPALLGSKTFPVPAPVPDPVTVSRSCPRYYFPSPSVFPLLLRFLFKKPNFQNELYKLLTVGRPPQGPPEYPQQF
jgi:hypothetical protein